MEVVYIIGHSHYGPVKVGISKNSLQRVRDLQCGNPDKLSVLYETDVCNAQLVEAVVHLRLCDFQTSASNEWFNVTSRHAYILVNSIAQKFCN